MEFTPSEEQVFVREVASQILDDQFSDDALAAFDVSGETMHREAWGHLAEAGLLGLALPEAVGGMALGLMELLVLVEEVGRTIAPVPITPTLVLGALPISEFGTEDQRAALLAGVADGETVLTAALADAGAADPHAAATTARVEGGGWVLDGVKVAVPALTAARTVLVPAQTPDGVQCFAVDTSQGGVTVTPQQLMNDEWVGELSLEAVHVLDSARLAGLTVDWLIDRAHLAQAAEILGMGRTALALTAAYTGTRHQFGMPIGAFQAVQQRAADMYIALQALEVALLQAAWRTANGLPADRETRIARYWAGHSGHHIVSAATHLHGGMGFDRDYALHRYYLRTKRLEFSLRGAGAQLEALGRWIVEHGTTQRR